MGPQFDAQGGNEGPRSWDAAIGRLASHQHGVVSLVQLLALGVTRRAIEVRVGQERLLRLHRGVYAVGHAALTSLSRDMAAVLACGPGALLSHRSAAHAWLLLRSSSARIEVTASRGCKPKPDSRVTWRDLQDAAGLAAELKSIRAQRLRAPKAA